MDQPKVEIHDDHLLIKLDRLARATTMRKSIVVPYSTISNASVEGPHWPGMLANRRIGAFIPGRLAVGTFSGWNGSRRLYDIQRKTRQALTLRLEGHPDYDEMELDVASAGEVVQAVSQHQPSATKSPPARE